MEDNVVDLDNSAPTVKSITSRFSRMSDDMKHITVIIEWKDGGTNVYYDHKCISELTFDHFVLGQEIAKQYEQD